jgi:hypothetical protein
LDWQLVLGPLGLTVFLVYVTKLLWDDHRKADQERSELLRDLTAAVNRLADAQEKQSKRR